jgi:uncharacterized Zn finger protein
MLITQIPCPICGFLENAGILQKLKHKETEVDMAYCNSCNYLYPNIHELIPESAIFLYEFLKKMICLVVGLIPS